MKIAPGQSYAGPLGSVFTVEEITAGMVRCSVSPGVGVVTFAERDAEKWLQPVNMVKSDPAKNL